MKTRILALLLAAIMLLALAACGSSNTGSSSPTDVSKDTAQEPADTAKDTPPADEPDAAGEGEPSAGESVEPYQFNISYGGTPSSSMVAVMELLQSILTEESGGAFTFNTYNDNSYNEAQALDEMMNNIVDIVYLASASTSTTVTEVAYLGMPGCYRYSDDANAFFDYEATLAPIMSDIYDGYGIHYLGLRYPARMALVGTGEVPTSPDDLGGKIVRVSGTWLGRLAVSMNLATANVGLSELATALQRGTIDSCITGIEQAYSQQLGEVADYAGILPETDGLGSLVMDNDTWEKLSDAQKACVERSVERWMHECAGISQDFYDTAIAHFEENGTEVYLYSADEADGFLATVSEVYAEIDANTTEKGFALRDAILSMR